MDGVIYQREANVEANVIGAIINDQNNITLIASTLHPRHFENDQNRAIYGCLLDMYNNGDHIDLTTATIACKRLKALREENVALMLAGYTSTAPLTGVVRYAQIIVETYLRRTIRNKSLQLAKNCDNEGVDVSEILNALNALSDKCNGVITNGGAEHIGGLIARAIQDAEERQKAQRNGEGVGITTGLIALNKATGGWKPSQLIILAGRPAMGKTAVMLHFALSASRQGRAVCIYSLEMSKKSLADRLLLSVADVDAERYRSGNLTPDDWKRINEAEAEIAKLPIYIDDKADASMSYIRAQSLLLQKRGQCDMIFVDYLQLVDTSTGKNCNREQEIANASRSAKMIAKELGVPFVLLSQLSRRVEERADKTPQLSDLRESGAIEQDADVVVFIYRPAYYGEQSITMRAGNEISAEGVGVLSIAKQRDGATGRVYFAHNNSLTRLQDYPPQHSGIKPIG